eukprot:scaffold549330_cov26-Prasinocladus_malaysianus.AAC.1
MGYSLRDTLLASNANVGGDDTRSAVGSCRDVTLLPENALIDKHICCKLAFNTEQRTNIPEGKFCIWYPICKHRTAVCTNSLRNFSKQATHRSSYMQYTLRAWYFSAALIW